MGATWDPLTPNYKKWKKNHGNRRLMELTGKLFEAVQGGQGWKEKIKKKELTIGIDGEEYYVHVQDRKTNPRNYFLTKNKDLPNRAYAFLIKEMDDYLGVDDE